MSGKLRRAWPIVKALLWLVILFTIGRQFARDLHRPELLQRSLHGGWLVLSGLLYLLGLSLSALYWNRLLGHLGSRPPLAAALRAYYIGHLGKYLPGKAWAVLLRTNLVRGHGVSAGLAALTSFYEVLTTMAAGALVAAVLFAVLGADAGAGLNADTLRQLLRLEQPTEGGLQRPVVVLLSLLLFVAIILPLQPAIFNRLARRMSLPFRERDAAAVAAHPFRLSPRRLGVHRRGLALARRLASRLLCAALSAMAGP